MHVHLASPSTPPSLRAWLVRAGDPVRLPPDLEPLEAPLREAIAEEKFQGKVGQRLAVRPLGLVPGRWVLLLGVGDGEGIDAVRQAAGHAGRFARDHRLADATLDLSAWEGDAEGAVRAATEGLAAGNHRFERFRAERDRTPPLEAAWLVGLAAPEHAVEVGRIHARAQALARELVELPAEDIHPATLAERAAALAGPSLGVEVWDEERMAAEGMGGVLAVGRGSARPPRFVHMTYEPPGTAHGHVAVVGKGVTFDAGGLSIKPSNAMLGMKCDMAGAAVVIGVMSALADLGVQVRVEGIFAAAENLLGGAAYKLGDVLTMLDGRTVEIHNTDAEGRLLLADCLAYASRLGVKQCIDLATLTGAAVVALGEHYTALYTDDDAFAAAWRRLAAEAGEGLWRMPLEPSYAEKLKSPIADLKNVGGREGGSITAALFLKEFVDGPTWAHFDIAGPAYLSSPDGYLEKGATGAMVRTVLRWLETF